MNNNITFVAVSAWISTTAAKELKNKLIEEGTYSKTELKLSSYRWADVKDHSKGYICRLMAVKGINPDMEIVTSVRKSKSNSIGCFVSEQNTGNIVSDGMKMTYFCRRNSIDETMTA